MPSVKGYGVYSVGEAGQPYCQLRHLCSALDEFDISGEIGNPPQVPPDEQLVTSGDGHASREFALSKIVQDLVEQCCLGSAPDPYQDSIKVEHGDLGP